jgi:hypothetical protein
MKVLGGVEVIQLYAPATLYPETGFYSLDKRLSGLRASFNLVGRTVEINPSPFRNQNMVATL